MDKNPTNIETQTFIADDLFNIGHVQSIPGMPTWANLRFTKKKIKPLNFSGSGIYAVFFDKYLIYVGKFLGKKNNPFGGDIRDARWDKHLGSMTLRSRNTSFSKKSLGRILHSDGPHLVGDLRIADQDTLLRDRGCLSTFNKFSFGSRYWNLFQNLDESHLKRFQFLYVRVSAFTVDTGEIRKFVSDAESQIVKLLNPCCNAVVEFPDAPSKHEMHTIKQAQLTISKVLSGGVGNSAPARTDVKTIPATSLTVIRGTFIDEDDYAKTSSALFFERLENAPECASNLVRGICEQFSYAAKTEVHFKKRNPPDLRVRDQRPRSSGTKAKKGQNIFTLEWRPTKNVFLCRAMISPDQCLALGISNASIPASQTEPLNSEFRFTALIK